MALAILGIAFAATCIWLGVRIVNRRERWAKWTAAALVVVTAGYPLSWGPVYAVLRINGLIECPAYHTIYGPFFLLNNNGPESIMRLVDFYGELCLWCVGSLI